MSVAMQGLGRLLNIQPPSIVVNYLNDDDSPLIEKIYQFFANVIQEYSARENLQHSDSLVFSYALRFDAFALTRCMSPEQRKNTQQRPFTAEKVHRFIRQLARPRGIATIAADLPNYEQYPTLALTAHMLGGDVTEDQVVSTSLLYLGIDQFIKNPWFMQIQPSGGGHKTFFAQYRNDKSVPEFKTISLFENSTFVQKFFQLNDRQMRELCERIKLKPDSEHYYHTIALPLGHVSSPGHLAVIQLIKRLKPVFVETDFRFGLARSVMVIPSFSMLQECAYALYEDAMEYRPLMGICTTKEIEHFKMKFDMCVLQVGTPEAPLPVEADGLHFGPFSRALHDWYHGERGCWIGAYGRRAICYIVGHIFASPIDKETSSLIWNLLDGELWHKSENFGYLFTIPGVVRSEKHKRAIIRNMALLTRFWKLEFTITPEQLLPADKNLFDTIAAQITPEERQAAKVALFQYYNTQPEKNVITHFRLGCLHYEGYGTDVSYERAIEHWKRCGSAQALYCIAKVYVKEAHIPSRRALAYKYCLEAAEKGYAEAQCDIGWWYYSGHALVKYERRWDLALNFFRRAAAQGQSNALYNLGIMYRDGQGCRMNLDDALAFFRQAADLGLSSAQYQIGFWYQEGNSILPRDLQKARHYFTLAAAQNHPMAYYALSLHHANGWKCRKDLQRAEDYLKKSAELGYLPAIRLLESRVPPKQKKRSLSARSVALTKPVTRERSKRRKR